MDDYAARLTAAASQAGVELGQPRFHDDEWPAKVAQLTADPLAVTSFTFGCPDQAIIAALQAAGSEAWVTVTTPAEARQAASAGADVLVVQGSEAGGHRGSFTDDPADDAAGELGLLSLIQLVRSQTELPLVAAGGITHRRGRRRRPRGGRERRAARHRVPALPGSQHGAGAPGRSSRPTRRPR